jgi:hypothetical protein
MNRRANHQPPKRVTTGSPPTSALIAGMQWSLCRPSHAASRSGLRRQPCDDEHRPSAFSATLDRESLEALLGSTTNSTSPLLDKLTSRQPCRHSQRRCAFAGPCTRACSLACTSSNPHRELVALVYQVKRAPRFPPSRLVQHLPSGQRHARRGCPTGQVSNNP